MVYAPFTSRLKKLSVGIGTGLVLATVMLGLLLVPVTPRNDEEDPEKQRTAKAFDARWRGLVNLGVLVTIESPKKISLSGPALGNQPVTVGSLEEFARVARSLDGPGTAVVLAPPLGESSHGGEIVDVAVTKRKLQWILSENGFHDPTTE